MVLKNISPGCGVQASLMLFFLFIIDRKLLNNNKKMEDSKKVEAQEVIKSREGTPKMLKTVIKVIDPESKIHSYLKTNRYILI